MNEIKNELKDIIDQIPDFANVSDIPTIKAFLIDFTKGKIISESPKMKDSDLPEQFKFSKQPKKIEVKEVPKKKAKKKEVIEEPTPESTIKEELELVSEAKEIINDRKAELEAQLKKAQLELEKIKAEDKA